MKSLLPLHRIAIIAEDPLVRGGLVSRLASESGFAIVNERSALSGPGSEMSVDLRVWDVARRLPGDLSELADTPTLALVDDEESALGVLHGGALGVLSRSADAERLVAALHAVAGGLGVIEPALLGGLLRARSLPPDAVSLTPREHEVLGLVAEGLSNKLIADRLKISEHTVKFHVNAPLEQTVRRDAHRGSRAGRSPGSLDAVSGTVSRAGQRAEARPARSGDTEPACR